MTILNPIVYLSNRFGIPRIATNSVIVNTSSVSFTVPSNEQFAKNYNGLILLKMPQSIPEGTTTTLPINVTSTVGGLQNITVLGGGNYTVADYLTGIHLAYYESNTGTLQLLV